MSTSKEFIVYLQEQLRELSDITFRPMMGEYLVYYRGKLIGDVCDNRLLVKPVPAAINLLPLAEMRPPYSGAKPMIYVEDIENKQLLVKLFNEMYEELPFPKPKKKKV